MLLIQPKEAAAAACTGGWRRQKTAAPRPARTRDRAVTQTQGQDDLGLMGSEKRGEVAEGSQVNDGDEQQGGVIRAQPQPLSQPGQKALGKIGCYQGIKMMAPIKPPR